MSELVLGLDLGTSEAKAGLFDLAGRPLGLTRSPYPMSTDSSGRAEQAPADWWRALGESVRALGAGGATIAAIVGVGQGPTLVAVDEAGNAARPAITWRDRRATGSGGFGLLPKMAWLAGHEPASLGRTRWLLSAWDALGLWLSGRAASSLQAHESPIGPDVLRAAGLEPDLVPAPVAVGSRLGELRPEAAAVLGLRPGIPVLAGVNDGTASLIGGGLRRPGDAIDVGGSAGGFAVYTDRSLELPGTFVAPAPLPGLWVAGGATASAGAGLGWLRDQVFGGRWSFDELLAEASLAPPGADGLVFLPYLAGERAPIFDETARGLFFGLTLEHERRHLVRAVIEGAAFALRHLAEPIVAAGVEVTEMRLAGPARAELWLRVKADVSGFPVALPRVSETAVLGAAILAAAGERLVPSLAEGVRTMTGVERRAEPDPGRSRIYDRLFGVYRDLYPAVRGLYGRLAEPG